MTSELGKGTLFRIFLPAAIAEPASPYSATDVKLQGRGQRIWLVDDEPSVLRSLTLLLQRHGFVVTSYADPERALTSFWTAPQDVDLLLTDLQMPGLTGLMLAECVRATRPDLPVVLMSGHLNEVSVDTIERIQFAGVLAKPVLLPQLGALLSEIFARRA